MHVGLVGMIPETLAVWLITLPLRSQCALKSWWSSADADGMALVWLNGLVMGEKRLTVSLDVLGA